MKEDFKTVAQMSDPFSAEITAGMLRAAGIPAQVFGQASSYPSINANIDAVQVRVPADDYEAAMQLLATPPEFDAEEAEGESPSEEEG